MRARHDDHVSCVTLEGRSTFELPDREDRPVSFEVGGAERPTVVTRHHHGIRLLVHGEQRDWPHLKVVTETFSNLHQERRRLDTIRTVELLGGLDGRLVQLGVVSHAAIESLGLLPRWQQYLQSARGRRDQGALRSAVTQPDAPGRLLCRLCIWIASLDARITPTAGINVS